jgi:large subunit ribosomal protein L21
MYAVIETGGKQYRVEPGDVIDVERVSGQEGQDQGSVRFDRVLMATGDNGAQFGNPVIEGALVKASLVGEVRGPKIRVFKKKKRTTYRKSRGHRQDLMRVRIEGIELP